METVIIVIHLMIVLALVGVILIQRSEGGGLGIGGGSGFMTARGAANALTRATAILAAAFFVTALGLSILARYGGQPGDILDRAPAPQANAPAQAVPPVAAPANGGGGQGVLDQLGAAPSAPTQPAPPSGGANDAAPVTQTAPAGEPAAPQPTTPQVPTAQ
jgi:preprotein translocase subunit SecG